MCFKYVLTQELILQTCKMYKSNLIISAIWTGSIFQTNSQLILTIGLDSLL